MQIIPLSEGSFTVDSSKQFVPFHEGEDELNERKRGSILVEIQPFLIVTKKDVILLDAGLGQNDENGYFQLYRNIKNAGFEPDEITKVLMSHLHKDHIGGLINPYTHLFSFENALLYIQKSELEYAYQKAGSSYSIPMLDLISSFDNLELIKTDKGEIDYYIEYEVTGAHSKYHQVFWIREDEEVAFFGGDDLSQYNQLKRRYKAKYDYDGEKAMELRENWHERGKKERWSFLFYHDSQKSIFKFK